MRGVVRRRADGLISVFENGTQRIQRHGALKARKSMRPMASWLSVVVAFGLGFAAPPSRAALTPGPDARALVDLSGVLPADRQAVWDPGLNPIGGIPRRTRVCARVRARREARRSDTKRIQRALNRCRANGVVKLSRGIFRITGDGLAINRSNVTLRGSGWGTRLQRKGGDAAVISVGRGSDSYGRAVDLAADAAQGARSVTVARDPGLRPGDIVTLNERSDPSLTVWGNDSPPGDASRGWYNEMDRPIGQVLEVKAVSGRSISFTTPLHIDLHTSRGAHLVRRIDSSNGRLIKTVRGAGVESLSVFGGRGGDSGGNIHFNGAAYSWVRNVNASRSDGGSVTFDESFRCVLRDSYVHSTVNPNPGGGGYGISLGHYASDNLVENNISWNFNKVIVMRATGGGNVVAYNYMDDAWGADYRSYVETGLNASHGTTPHHELFEGNQSFNFDGDTVWGNSIYITAFRNDLTGQRRSIRPLRLQDLGNRKAIGLTHGHWWYSFVGNVLGRRGQTPPPGARFVYETDTFGDDSVVPMWKLGYTAEDESKPQDLKVVETAIRHGNFDYVTGSVVWSPGLSQSLPPSLYLTTKPSFFGARAWPWVTPESEPRAARLPARERFDRLH